jgi:hypothetical protein
MRYPKLHQQGFCTSTGVVEAGCKVVIGTRLKRTGMHIPPKSDVRPGGTYTRRARRTIAVSFPVARAEPVGHPVCCGGPIFAHPGNADQFLSLRRSQASTIFVGSIASESTCSSRIFPSFPIRKLTRRAALYLSM